jgi:ABC-2 type transport system permease protein
MTSAFVYMTLRGLVNRVRMRIRRPREPRYVLGPTAGLLYFYFVIFARRTPSRGRMTTVGFSTFVQYAGPVIAVASVLLFGVIALSWIFTPSSRALSFSRAEVQFLFPAPLTRRQLLHYKLIRSITASLIGSLVVTLFFRPGTLMAAWTVVTGMWCLFAILNLHFTGVALARQSLAAHGASALRRQWLPIAIVLGAVGVVGVALVRDWSILGSLETGPQVFAELGRILTTGAAGWALWPTRTLVRLPLSPTTADYWRALPGTGLLFAVNYIWVMRSDTAFEEASAEQSEKVVRGRLAPAKARVTAASTPFVLAAGGRIETAILWKNLIMLGRYASARTLWRLLPLVISLAIFVSAGRHTGLASMLSILALGGTGFAIILGPQIVRNDLRQDLSHLALLKTWPVSSAAIIRGELLAPAVVLTAVAWLLVIASVLLVGSVPSSASAVAVVLLNRASFGTAALLIAPPLIIIQLIVQNGLAVLFPAWAIIGAPRTRGVEVMGQRLLLQAGILLSLLLALLPAVLVGAAAALAIYLATGLVPVVVPAVLVAAVMLAEAFLATEALGRALDRADVGSLEPQD